MPPGCPRRWCCPEPAAGSAAAITINPDLVEDDVRNAGFGVFIQGPCGSGLALGDWLRILHPDLRTFILATIPVPIVIYGLMQRLHRFRVRLLAAHLDDDAVGAQQ